MILTSELESSCWNGGALRAATGTGGLVNAVAETDAAEAGSVPACLVGAGWTSTSSSSDYE